MKWSLINKLLPAFFLIYLQNCPVSLIVNVQLNTSLKRNDLLCCEIVIQLVNWSLVVVVIRSNIQSKENGSNFHSWQMQR